jgi:hypothetical protein
VPNQCASNLAGEIVGGDHLSFAAAARLFPRGRNDASVSPSCVFRWAKHGVETDSGITVRLEAIKLGSRWLTSKAAVIAGRLFQSVGQYAHPVAAKVPLAVDPARQLRDAAVAPGEDTLGDGWRGPERVEDDVSK